MLPQLSSRGVHSLVVTTGVIPIPEAWTKLPGVVVAVSVGGSPEDHNVRGKPATYERILRHIKGAKVDIHWTVVRQNIEARLYGPLSPILERAAGSQSNLGEHLHATTE